MKTSALLALCVIVVYEHSREVRAQNMTVIGTFRSWACFWWTLDGTTPAVKIEVSVDECGVHATVDYTDPTESGVFCTNLRDISEDEVTLEMQLYNASNATLIEEPFSKSFDLSDFWKYTISWERDFLCNSDGCDFTFTFSNSEASLLLKNIARVKLVNQDTNAVDFEATLDLYSDNCTDDNAGIITCEIETPVTDAFAVEIQLCEFSGSDECSLTYIDNGDEYWNNQSRRSDFTKIRTHVGLMITAFVLICNL